MKNTYTIIFMGTPEFAVPALKSLSEEEYKISLVVTQPDRPKGRGRKMVPPPVKQEAIHSGHKIIQPESIKTDMFYDQLKELEPDFIVVVAFGNMLPENLLSLPQLGGINIHPSLLPKYRGPAPIQHALINNEQETGVTIMMLDSGMDTGDILMSQKITIPPDSTSETLHNTLSQKGAELLVQTLEGFRNNTIKRTPQDHSKATYAPFLKKKDGLIDWHQPADKLSAFVRGMTPWPGAYTFMNGKQRIKIFKVKPAHNDQADKTAAPGTVLKGFSNELRISTGREAVSILEIQGASGKRLQINEFLKGCKIPPGTVFQAENA
jgi:methionyl-tRNA formyltransferase